VLCTALLLLYGGSALAAEPHSKQEAAAMGDPAATAPSSTTTKFKYKGRILAGSDVASSDLYCLTADPILGTEGECFDTAEEFRTAGNAAGRASRKHEGAATAARASSRPKAHMSACGQFYLILALRDRADYNGPAFGTSGFHYWDNYSSPFNNIASSYTTGDGSAHLAEGDRGVGYWYPGNTSYCSGNSIPAHYPQWDNRISSGYRNYN
jgi:hypothetical protein